MVDRVRTAALQQAADRQLDDDEHVGAVRIVRIDQDLAQPRRRGGGDQRGGGEAGEQRGRARQRPRVGVRGNGQAIPEQRERDVKQCDEDGGDQERGSGAEPRLEDGRDGKQQEVERKQQATRDGEHGQIVPPSA